MRRPVRTRLETGLHIADRQPEQVYGYGLCTLDDVGGQNGRRKADARPLVRASARQLR